MEAPTPDLASIARGARDRRRANGWYGMACWNALSDDQQHTLIDVGTLPIDYEAEGDCLNPATISIETRSDEAPGPRFYCRPCAIAYLTTAPVGLRTRTGALA